jgi:hypothetical protein
MTTAVTKKKTNPIVRLLFGGRIHEPGRPKKVGRWDLMNRIAWYHLWADVFTTNTQMRDSRTFPERDYNLYTNNRAIFSGKDNLVVFLSFDGYDTTLPMQFRAELRKFLHPTMRMFFTDYSIPTTIDWKDPKLEALLRNYKNTAEENKSLDDNAFEYQKYSTDLARDQWREESVIYLSNATSAKRKLEFFEYRCHAIVMGIRGEDFDESLEKIEHFCARYGVTVNRVVQHLADFTAAFSPLSMDHSRKSFGRVGKNVFSDEIIARFTGYDQGRIGTHGSYIARDVNSGYPILYKFRENDVDAENFVVIAETGGGKSFFVKNILNELMKYSRVRLTINDVEGDEYTPLVSFYANHDSCLILNMAEGQGSYFDPVEIMSSGDLAIDVENGTHGLAVNYTLSYLSALMGSHLHTYQWAESILKNAISVVYRNAGVLSDDEHAYTWKNSKGLTLHHVYQVIKDSHEALRTGAAKDDYRASDEDYIKSLTFVRAQLAEYFEPNGSRASVFSNRVSTEDVANARVVLCSFGMKSKATVMVDDVQLRLSQLSAASIHHVRSLTCKREGKFNLTVWEELQRWAAFPSAAGILGTAITGGRKMGDINLIISNEPSMFLEAGSKLKIFENIQSVAIGTIRDASVRNELAKRLSIEYLKDELTLLATANSKTSEDGPESSYKRAFVIKLSTGEVTLGKVVLPDGIAQSELFKTGSVEAVEDTAIEETSSAATVFQDPDDVQRQIDNLLQQGPPLRRRSRRAQQAAVEPPAEVAPDSDGWDFSALLN